MTRYWLTPILGYSPLMLGAERMSFPSDSNFESFCQLAGLQHPRLLSMFKASLLLSDDEDVCGSDLVELDLTHAGDIVFNGDPFRLSHCAEAFLDRLLNRREAMGFVRAMQDHMGSSNELHEAWTKQWLQWLEAGYDIVLLREDGR